MSFPATQIWVDGGTVGAAAALEAWIAGLGLEWILFTNNPLIFTSSDITILLEASFLGYARVLSSGWSVKPASSGGFVLDANIPSWNLGVTLPSALPVYGWGLIKPGPDTLYLAGKFDTAWLIQNLGDTIAFDPGFVLQSQMVVI